MNIQSSKYNNILFHPEHMTKVPDGQRALVLQGGGSLGAYEAGAYQALYERITKTDREKGDGKPFLNIVAGTSIGAINAAIIVSYVVEMAHGMAQQKDL